MNFKIKKKLNQTNKIENLCTLKDTILKMKEQGSDWQKILAKHLTKNQCRERIRNKDDEFALFLYIFFPTEIRVLVPVTNHCLLIINFSVHSKLWKSLYGRNEKEGIHSTDTVREKNLWDFNMTLWRGRETANTF